MTKHLIILAGNSLKNRTWGELMMEAYRDRFDSTFLLNYDHWANGSGNIDFAREEEKLKTHTAGLPADTEITIFAKSAGSLLAFLAVYHQIISPVSGVFFGIPFDLANQGIFKNNWTAVDTWSVPAIAFHNIADPTTSYEFTKTTLIDHAPKIKLITTNEADHWYGDVETYNKYIETK